MRAVASTITPCPHCGEHGAVSVWLKPIPWRNFDFEVVCSDCCGEADSFVAYGATAAEAVADWDEHADEHAPCVECLEVGNGHVEAELECEVCGALVCQGCAVDCVCIACRAASERKRAEGDGRW